MIKAQLVIYLKQIKQIREWSLIIWMECHFPVLIIMLIFSVALIIIWLLISIPYKWIEYACLYIIFTHKNTIKLAAWKSEVYHNKCHRHTISAPVWIAWRLFDHNNYPLTIIMRETVQIIDASMMLTNKITIACLWNIVHFLE